MKFSGMIGYYPGAIWLDFGIDRVKCQGQGHEKVPKKCLRRRYALDRVPVLVHIESSLFLWAWASPCDKNLRCGSDSELGNQVSDERTLRRIQTDL